MLLIVRLCIDTIAHKKKAFYLSSCLLQFGISFLGSSTKEMLEERPLKHIWSVVLGLEVTIFGTSSTQQAVLNLEGLCASGNV